MELLILGAGGLGGVVAETAQMIGVYSKIAFLDDNAADAIGKLDEADKFRTGFSHAIPAVGDNQKRCELLDMLRVRGYQIPVIIHPSAFVSPNACLGEGTIVRAMAAVSRDVVIGEGCLINVGALINHGCRIGKGSHIPMGCVVRGEVEVPEMSVFEPNSVVEGIV